MLLQRVTEAAVKVNDAEVARIGTGLLVFICAVAQDTTLQVDRVLEKIGKLRIFSDPDGKMNLSVRDIQGGLLLVPQFTLAGSTKSGNRPSFDGAARPELATPLFDYACAQVKQQFTQCGFGVFGADMKVSLINDGPVTLWLEEVAPAQ